MTLLFVTLDGGTYVCTVTLHVCMQPTIEVVLKH